LSPTSKVVPNFALIFSTMLAGGQRAGRETELCQNREYHRGKRNGCLISFYIEIEAGVPDSSSFQCNHALSMLP